MPNWIREQICDLGYDEDVADKVANVSASFTRQVLMEMSYEDIASDLTTSNIDENVARAMARGLFSRIQKGIAQPQPVSWQRLVLVVARVCCVFVLFLSM